MLPARDRGRAGRARDPPARVAEGLRGLVRLTAPRGRAGSGGTCGAGTAGPRRRGACVRGAGPGAVRAGSGGEQRRPGAGRDAQAAVSARGLRDWKRDAGTGKGGSFACWFCNSTGGFRSEVWDLFFTKVTHPIRGWGVRGSSGILGSGNPWWGGHGMGGVEGEVGFGSHQAEGTAGGSNVRRV